MSSRSEAQIKAIKNITVTTDSYQRKENTPLLSIHLASFRPDQFTEFVKNIHEKCINKNAYEILVKVDTEDTKMIDCVNELAKQYGENKIKPLIGLRKLGPWSLWEFYNGLFQMAHPEAYFVWLPSDEVRINNEGWDKILEKYIGFFKDDVFRLKLSENRLRNFYHLHEVLGCPDNFPIITKKWMDIVGLWGDCHSPDLFQQAVSYYLGRKNIFRDIPIFDIDLSGIEAGLLLDPKKLRSRSRNILRLWQRALSYKMRNRYVAHATKLKFYIDSYNRGAKVIQYQENLILDELVCSNDLGVSEKHLCTDKIYLADQRLYNMEHPIEKYFNKILRAIYRCIPKAQIKSLMKYLLGWYSLDVVSSQPNIQFAGKSHYYALVKSDTNWTLFYYDAQKNETKIPIETVYQLSEVLQSLPNVEPSRFFPYEIARIRRAITLYHANITLKIKNRFLLKKLYAALNQK